MSFIYKIVLKISKVRIFILFLLLAGNSAISVASDLIFTAAPRETPAAGNKLYGPVTEYISKITGKSVKYYHAGYWLRYQSDIKKFKYDFVLDGPHLASWRIKNVRHKPLIKLPGYLQFYMLARKDDRKINRPEDLIYKKVCVIPPPNLTAVMLLQRLNDPVREPFLVGVKGGMKMLVEKLIAGECSATVVRSSYYDHKMTDEMKNKVKIIYTSPKLPNQVITVSDRISDEERQQLTDALLSDEGRKVLAPLVKRFGGKGVVSFVKVDEHEYDGYFSFLEGVVLGW